MKITKKEWFLFLVLAIFSFVVWFKLGYPEFASVDLSVDRNSASRKADSYLTSLGVNPKDYFKAIVFVSDDWTDRYLQKTIGLKAEEEFIKKHGFDLFSWQVRYFKELKKEEYLVAISPKTAKIIGFRHLIEDIEPRTRVEEESARWKATEFLEKNSALDLNDYEFHDKNVRRLENRIDYSFTWEKKGVVLPWADNEGQAKLLTGVTISGDEPREFFINSFDVPENFRRYIDKQSTLGEYLATLSFMGVILLLIWSVYIVIKKQHTVIVRSSKTLYLRLGLFFVVINLLSIANNFQNVIVSYPTSVYLASFIGIYLVRAGLNLVYFSVDFIVPGLAGEYLIYENRQHESRLSFLPYIKSAWLTRSVSASILLGYLLFMIMLGLQAALFSFGQKYFGVWKEWILLKQLSSAYVPFFGAFVLACGASIGEEIMFRLFGISWGEKYLKNTFLAVLVTSLIWGISHSRYSIFPTWFRGAEVTLLGILLGFMFLKYGIIAVISAHYLFDAFWGTAAHLLGRSSPYLFFGSLTVMAFPLGLALLAYLANKSEQEREVKLMLNATQRYNLEILNSFVNLKKTQGMDREVMKKELSAHNWDAALIDLAIKEAFGEDV